MTYDPSQGWRDYGWDEPSSDWESRNEKDAYDYTRIVKKTDNAGLFEIDEEQYWLPWSQIEHEEDEDAMDGSGTVYVPYWLAEEKGMV